MDQDEFDRKWASIEAGEEPERGIGGAALHTMLKINNLMWGTKIALAMADERVPFETPDDMDEFSSGIMRVHMGMLAKDTPFVLSALYDLGLGNLAEQVRAMPEMRDAKPIVNLAEVADMVRQKIKAERPELVSKLWFLDDMLGEAGE